MKIVLLLAYFIIGLLGFAKSSESLIPDKIVSDSLKISQEGKLKFVILCFKLSPPYDAEITALNKLADEYKNYVSPVVIKDEELNKYKELFTRNEYRSLEEFVSSKPAFSKYSTSFPVILILDKNGKITNAWSGDKTDDGLKPNDFYVKIKAGLEAISKDAGR